MEARSRPTPRSAVTEPTPTTALSRDRRLVAFRSYAKNLVAVDVNKEVDAFVYDLATSTMRLASLDDQGNQPGSYSYRSTPARATA